jgi:hypothetical protein
MAALLIMALALDLVGCAWADDLAMRNQKDLFCELVKVLM